MCGFTGFLTKSVGRLDINSFTDVANSMSLALKHRGPDDVGVWADAQAGIALGFRRLAIVDLSAAGHQPMVSASGRIVMTFNGEIYNHLALRAELTAMGRGASPAMTGAQQWRGYSDTETLMAGFETWGVEVTLQKTVGMFAIAIWDTQDKTLTLVRDRFGEKPLYYGWVGSGANAAFVFGSELKALRSYPGFDNSISREALGLFMRFTHVPAPHSIYQNIFKLEPGCMLTIRGGISNAPNAPLHPPAAIGGLVLHRWWALSDAVTVGTQNQIIDEAQALHAVEHCLKEAVQLQSLADVPLGAFLSGGVDSSIIVALMQQQSMRKVKTFTVGFEETGFDESPHARVVAQYLGTDHNELFVTATEAQGVISSLSAIYDEPFADSSQIPTHLVCKAARQQITVALSGDAGDELFGGYNRYFWAPRIWKKLAWLPYPARQALGKTITTIPIAAWDGLGHMLNDVRTGEKLHKLGRAINRVRNLDGLYSNLLSEWLDPAGVVKGCETQLFAADLSIHSPPVINFVERMMYHDSMTYLPNDILCKVDRAAMATGLETRMPFLDHRLAELSWKLPLHMKIRGNEGKWALRQVLYELVPRELIDRPKVGFSVPVGEWLRGPLRSWAESLLDERRLQTEGYFYSGPIRKKWTEHLVGHRDHTASLWAVLMFQAWLEKNV